MMKRWAVALVGLSLLLQEAGQGQRMAGGAGDEPTYYEFGTVVAMAERSVEVQSYDPMQQGMVRHSFVLDRETRADLMHVGDAVEVIYEQDGMELLLRRLLVLSGGIPKAGPPNNGIGWGDAAVIVPLGRAGVGASANGASAGSATSSSSAATTAAAGTTSAAATAAPAASASGVASGMTGRAGARSRAAGSYAAKTTGAKAGASSSTTAAASASAAATSASTAVAGKANTGAASGTSPVNLGSSAGPRPTVVIPVNVGEVLAAAQPVAKPVRYDRPAEECNRSSAEWPARPLSIAVLDFRYPTEREESHDIARTGGGSGTQVADLIFGKLEQQPEFAVDRGDRRRLDRTDIAGAARLGRQLGVDAVLAGTLVPVEEPPDADGYAVKTRFYELRAGLVDTCTGQVLMKLTSNTCNVMDGSANSTAGGCAGASVTAKQAENPAAHPQAFEGPIETLLHPLEHNVTAASAASVAGTVTGVSERGVTLQLAPGAQLRAGDEVAVRASRLAKNPTTYTLNALQDEEIGRVIVRSVQGGTATGTFSGDIQPKAGDAVVVVTQ